MIGNIAGARGGGAFYGTLYSCVVSGNRAGTNGGGSYYSTLECCTVVDNEAINGGGSYLGTAYYSVMRYNRAAAGPQYSDTVSYGCCTEPFEPSVTYSPILAVPQLTGLRDPHLLAGSPCVDGGDYRGWMQGANGFDMDGETRYVFGAYDVGADERHEGGLSGPLSVTVRTDRPTVGQHYAPEFWADAEGLVGDMFWLFGDGTAALNQNPVSHAYAAPGIYDVVVTVSNAAHLASATQTVEVVAGDVYVSLAGGHVPPFASWAGAATNIQDAVDAAIYGGTVWLADGIYDEGARAAAGETHPNRVCIEKPVTVCGANGPAGAIIRGAWCDPGVTPWGAGAVRGVYLGHAEARLIGVTVADAAAGLSPVDGNGGGIYCAISGAGGSNCVVRGCGAYYDGGGVSGGSWKACVISGNVADENGGGAADAVLDTCALTGNTAASDGGGAAESVLSDCTVTGNEAQGSDGGGLYYCTATRCLIRENRAYDDGGGSSSDGDPVNCLLADNESGYGGGAAYGTLDACTVSSNTATSMAGGLYDVDYCLNTIIWSNHAPVDAEWSYGYYENCLVAPLPEGGNDGGGNLTGDPRFANPAAGNYRLAGSSPCINAGALKWYAAEEGAVDLDGRPRVLASAPDIGAYEYASQEGYAALGTPIDWLTTYYGGPDWDAAELDDSDSDGVPAWMEYVALTDPTDGESVFVIRAIVVDGSGTELSFQTATGRVYTVLEAATPSAAAFAPADTPFPGTGGLVAIPAGNGPFYRIRVSLPYGVPAELEGLCMSLKHEGHSDPNPSHQRQCAITHRTKKDYD